jgi:hypothetical protein
MPGKVEVLNGQATSISLDGRSATITAGGSGANGIVSLHDPSTDPFARILLNAGNGTLAMSGVIPGVQGFHTIIGLHADRGDLSVGGNGKDGDLVLCPAGVQQSDPSQDKTKVTIHLRAGDATVRAGGGGLDGRMLVLNDKNIAMVTLDGKSGDIVLYNGDCAEEFDLATDGLVEPGTSWSLTTKAASARARKPTMAASRASFRAPTDTGRASCSTGARPGGNGPFWP